MKSSFTSWGEVICYALAIVFLIALFVGVSYLIESNTQTKMDGGLIIDKYMSEGHYENYPVYNAGTKTMTIGRRWVSPHYTLVVRKEIEGELRIKEVPVDIDKYYSSEIGQIYTK